jgi:predicted amidophosphoribosyltransferase
MALRKAAENLRLLFLKPVCPGCGAERESTELLCGWCALRLEPCLTPLRSADGNAVSPVETPEGSADDTASSPLDHRGILVYPSLLYSGVPREIVLRLKFGGERHLARPAAALMIEFSRVLPGPDDVVTSVPAGRRKLRERGYNQARLISRELASMLSVRSMDLLERDDGPSQVGLPLEERAANVRGVFRASRRQGRELPAGAPCIWIVDDVATTCSTIHSAAGTLIEEYGGRVAGLTLTYRSRGAGSMLR